MVMSLQKVPTFMKCILHISRSSLFVKEPVKSFQKVDRVPATACVYHVNVVCELRFSSWILQLGLL